MTIAIRFGRLRERNHVQVRTCVQQAAIYWSDIKKEMA